MSFFLLVLESLVCLLVSNLIEIELLRDRTDLSLIRLFIFFSYKVWTQQSKKSLNQPSVSNFYNVTATPIAFVTV